MFHLIKTTLLLTFILGVTWESAETSSIGFNPLFSYDNVTFTRLYRRPRQSNGGTGSTCITPEQPLNGNWTYINNSLGVANSEFSLWNNILYRCNDGYKLSTTNDDIDFIICLSDSWSKKEMPICEKLCSPFNNTNLITYECKKNGQNVSCDKATDNTVMNYSCAAYYEQPAASPLQSTCSNGAWSSIPKCVPVCGQKRGDGDPVVVGGHTSMEGAYPWVVALYKKNEEKPLEYEQRCGGTLLTLSIVLTAAHCVTHPTSSDTYEIIPRENLKVAAGKYYRKYKHENETTSTIYVDVLDIKHHIDFEGHFQNFRGDIALLKLENELSPSETIQPVCYESLPKLDRNSRGVVTGWGYITPSIQQKLVAEKLQYLELPYTNFQECKNSFGHDSFRRYVISDKMCAGFNNQGRSVCKGDSGGGLTFRDIRYKRFFVHGVVSTSQIISNNSGDYCNVDKNAVYTSVEHYSEWISEVVREWESKSYLGIKCITPPQPDNGIWTYDDKKTGEVNVSVGVGTTIIFTCHAGYTLNLARVVEQSVSCRDTGEWDMAVMPTCIAK